MERIGYTVMPPTQPSLQDWLAEFKCGLTAPKKNDRAQDIMNTWTVDHKPVDWKKFIERKLADWK